MMVLSQMLQLFIQQIERNFLNGKRKDSYYNARTYKDDVVDGPRLTLQRSTH